MIFYIHKYKFTLQRPQSASQQPQPHPQSQPQFKTLIDAASEEDPRLYLTELTRQVRHHHNQMSILASVEKEGRGSEGVR